MSGRAPDASVISKRRLVNASTRAVTLQATSVNTPSAAGAASHKMQADSSAARASHSKPGVWVAAVLVLGITFWLYVQPDVVILLADQLWSCF